MEYRGFDIEECERIDDDAYRAMIDETCEPFRIGSLEYPASMVLEAVDPVAYRCGIGDVQEYYYVVNAPTMDIDDEEYETEEDAREAIDNMLEEIELEEEE